MPPFDREGALKSAEKALRQGRIDAAIADYVRVVEAQPRDWNSANALGDLHVRAGHIDKGLAQYARIADHLVIEGFHSKAAALFKKILKLRPDDEYALVQCGEIAALQGTVVEAKQYFQAVEGRRRARGDSKGAAAMVIRLGALDPDDLESRLRAAAAAAETGDTQTALREFRDVAGRLERQRRTSEALAAYQSAFDLDESDEAIRTRLFGAYLDGGALAQARKVARRADELRRVAGAFDASGDASAVLEVLTDVVALDPHDSESRLRLARACIASGDLERARTFLSPQGAGKDPSLWLLLGEVDLRTGHLPEGRAAIAEALTIDKLQAPAAVVLACRLAEWSPAAGYQCIDAVAETALDRADYQEAASALSDFARQVPGHLVALLRLVEVSVDGGLEETLYDVQARLADAYLDLGRGLEARIISEDLVARDPRNKANLDRFRRALTMVGEHDPEAVIAERLSGDSPFFAVDEFDLNEGISFDAPAPAENSPAPVAAASAPVAPVAAAPVVTPPVAETVVVDQVVAAPPVPLEYVFKSLRDEAANSDAEKEAAGQYALAMTYLDIGMVDDAIKALTAAARSPRERFAAASALGRLCVEAGNPAQAVEWFERAAEAPAPSAEAARSLLYDLASTLEASGEESRALAVFVELATEAVAFRDVADRVARLSSPQSRG